uniref:RRM domain-containing protein n=1 Tax=Salix viminalis TaxID=40686 RepID=A0A6N2KBH2_SALVM
MRDAIEGMNGTDLDGRNITVTEAQSRGSGGGDKLELKTSRAKGIPPQVNEGGTPLNNFSTPCICFRNYYQSMMLAQFLWCNILWAPNNVTKRFA